jgi:hypothetical protein
MANIVEPARKSKIRLYHFTFPCRLPKIVKSGALVPDAMSPHSFMSGGLPCIWLTASATGNAIDQRHVRHFRKLGMDDLLAEIKGGRRLAFAADMTDEGGSARIALKLPKQAVTAGALVPYLPWVRAEMGVETWRYFRGFLSTHARDWWLCFVPIPVDLFEEISPVGEPSPGYAAAFKKIERRSKTAARRQIAAEMRP